MSDASNAEVLGTKQITAAVTVKTEKLKKIINDRLAPLIAERDENAEAIEKATKKREKEVAAYVVDNADSIQSAFEAKVVSRGSFCKGEYVTVEFDVTESEFTTVPSKYDDSKIVELQADLKLLELIEDTTLNVQPGSGKFGSYIAESA